VPKPDPRKPAGRVKFLLWKYWFKTARPGLPPPRDKRVVEAIAELARQPYDYQANWHAAAAAAKPFDANTLPDVLAVMVHPPPITDGTPAWIWLPRVQLAAAQVVAHLDRGWSVSDRWEALQELLRNPIDWTTEAAIIALAQLARQMPEISADVRRVYFELLQRVPRQGHCCYFSGLCHNWLLLPDVPDDERAQVNAMLTDSQAA
jgi:hypothetical protein